MYYVVKATINLHNVSILKLCLCCEYYCLGIVVIFGVKEWP